MVIISKLRGRIIFEGTLVTREIYQRSLLIYLPPGYPQDSHNYPVVFVQDGGDIFDLGKSDSIAVLEEMFDLGELPELILVGIEPLNRLDEYTPWPATALTERFADFGGQGSTYLRFVVEACKRMVARTKEAYVLLAANGAFQDRLHFTLDEGAEHQLPFFARRFPYALQWLFTADG